MFDRDRSIRRHATRNSIDESDVELAREYSWIEQLYDHAVCKSFSGYGWHGQVERACPHREAPGVEPLAKQASVLASESELTGVSLASHAAHVASFVHCRTRGCEAISSNLLFVLAFFFCLPPFFQFVIARPIRSAFADCTATRRRSKSNSINLIKIIVKN